MFMLDGLRVPCVKLNCSVILLADLSLIVGSAEARTVWPKFELNVFDLRELLTTGMSDALGNVCRLDEIGSSGGVGTRVEVLSDLALKPFM
mmetsp:Transcript_125212/g.249988  ORF Transcript_125212/g.249988 Transcript_125212/m.249988 type:complete len:91 (+) Transcript_125212:179-451(+)